MIYLCFFLIIIFLIKKLKKVFLFKDFLYLLNYDWPGNIREFKNVINRLCILSSNDEISVNLISDVLNEVLNELPEALSKHRYFVI